MVQRFCCYKSNKSDQTHTDRNFKENQYKRGEGVTLVCCGGGRRVGEILPPEISPQYQRGKKSGDSKAMGLGSKQQETY